MFEKWRTLWVPCALAVLLSCGGRRGAARTATAAATLSNGPVTGLGSVIVDGVRFDDSGASIVDQDDMALTTTSSRSACRRAGRCLGRRDDRRGIGRRADDPRPQRADRPGRQRRPAGLSDGRAWAVDHVARRPGSTAP